MKHSESKQIGCESYKPLPPLVIQGSYNYTEYEDGSQDRLSVQSIVHHFLNNQSVLVSQFETTTEVDVGAQDSGKVLYTEYLLDREERVRKSNFWMVKGLGQNVWRFVKDKNFLCVHLKFN